MRLVYIYCISDNVYVCRCACACLLLVLTDAYRSASGVHSHTLRRWAYEIHSTFLVPNAVCQYLPAYATYLTTLPIYSDQLPDHTTHLTTQPTWPYCLPNHTNYLTTLPTSLHYLHDYTSYLTTLPTWPTFIHALSIYTSFCYCPITRYPIRGNRPQSKYISRSFLFGYVIIPIYGYFPIIHPINLLDMFVFLLTLTVLLYSLENYSHN